MLQTSTSIAQVTGVVSVTVTVIPRPAVDFSPAPNIPGLSIVGGSFFSERGITLHGSSNVLVKLNFNKRDEDRELSFQQSRVKTISARELRDVKTVEIDYLGS